MDFVETLMGNVHYGMVIDGINLQNCAGITSGSRSSSSNSVAAFMSLLPLLLYCHRGLDFEYFWVYCWKQERKKKQSATNHVIENRVKRKMGEKNGKSFSLSMNLRA